MNDCAGLATIAKCCGAQQRHISRTFILEESQRPLARSSRRLRPLRPGPIDWHGVIGSQLQQSGIASAEFGRLNAVRTLRGAHWHSVVLQTSTNRRSAVPLSSRATSVAITSRSLGVCCRMPYFWGPSVALTQEVFLGQGELH
jgi:hypothetical protein